MAKRMLDCVASDFAHFTKEDFLSSIAGNGLILLSERYGISLEVK